MRPRAGLVVLGTLLLSCSGSAAGPDRSGLTFSVLPLPLQIGIKVIIARGTVAPPGHTLPTAHDYFYNVDFSNCPCHPPGPLPVLAPAAGRLSAIVREGPDVRVTIRVTSGISYYLNHLVIDPRLQPGDAIAAGDFLGFLNPNAVYMEFGVINLSVRHAGLVAPARYPDAILHSDGPLQYFEPSLRDQLIPLVRRNAADFDGKLDFDRAGKLVGNWFLEGVPQNTSSVETQNGPKQLAFAYDVIEPTQVRIAIGGTIDLSGVWGIAPGDPLPESVTPASGLVLFHLQSTGSPPSDYGRLLVRMLDATTLKVEKFPPGTGVLSFDVNAKLYVR